MGQFGVPVPPSMDTWVGSSLGGSERFAWALTVTTQPWVPEGPSESPWLPFRS